jgi:hypothetical protein
MASSLLFRLDLQTMPIDDRVSSQDETNGLEIHQGKLIDALEGTDRVVGHGE